MLPWRSCSLPFWGYGRLRLLPKLVLNRNRRTIGNDPVEALQKCCLQVDSEPFLFDQTDFLCLPQSSSAAIGLDDKVQSAAF